MHTEHSGPPNMCHFKNTTERGRSSGPHIPAQIAAQERVRSRICSARLCGEVLPELLPAEGGLAEGQHDAEGINEAAVLPGPRAKPDAFHVGCEAADAEGIRGRRPHWAKPNPMGEAHPGGRSPPMLAKPAPWGEAPFSWAEGPHRGLPRLSAHFLRSKKKAPKGRHYGATVTDW